ncbi:hypothetical protein F9278_31140 [Streptomyces phaeolivaceus]|uniref:Uncharacterized protein n=1 Tax=Streptomyces phaeolivaceus TaxID=2653200 RepID=A0A5P8K9F5_9ACTN|nr:hypothetical protein F9278_31140 [Streptomyces phaeolivaceus]
MLRHEFRPGKLVAGLVLTAAGVVYLGDAGDAWETPWFVVIPLVVGGLCLAGAVGFLDHAIREWRGAGRAGPRGSAGPTGPTGGAGPTGETGPTRETGSAGGAGTAGTADGERDAGPRGSVG